MPQQEEPEDFTIPLEDLSIQRSSPLGGARTGSVYRGLRGNAEVVAVKMLASEVPQDALSQRFREWKALAHPCVHTLFGISPATCESPYMVTECHPTGNIRQFLTRNPNTDRLTLVFETALAMQYLHKNGVIHGCLKPSNILIKSDGRVCVSDYGMTDLQPSRSPDAHRYFSPEAWKGTTSAPSDVFAFAMTALEIFTSSPTWGALPEKHIYQIVVYEDGRPDRPDLRVCTRSGLSDSIWEIIEESWMKEPRLRPTFDIIIRLWQVASPQSANHPLVSSSGPGPQQSTRAVSNVTPTVLRLEHLRQHSSNTSSSSSGGPPAYEVEQVASDPGTSDSPAPLSPRLIPTPLSPRGLAHRDPKRSRTAPPTAQLHTHRVTPSTSGSSSSNEPNSPGPITPQADAESFRPAVRTANSATSLNSAYATQPLKKRFTTSFVPPPIAESQSFSSFGTPPPVSAPPLAQTFSSSSSQSRNEHIGRDEIAQWTASTSIDRAPIPSDIMSIRSETLSVMGAPTVLASSPMLLVGALQAEVADGRNQNSINDQLAKIQYIASANEKDAQRLITAGVVPTLIHLLRTRAVTMAGLEIVLMGLGFLAHDSISANTIYRTNTMATLIEVLRAANSHELRSLTIWCLIRLCRGPEIAMGLLRQGLVRVLLQKGFLLQSTPEDFIPSSATRGLTAYCIGNLAQNDGLAESLSEMGVIPHLSQLLKVSSEAQHPEGICAATYALARVSRSIKLAKAISKAGCVPILARNLTTSHDSCVLNWSSRAVGCLMRPSSSDMSKLLLDCGVARGLARLPGVIPQDQLEPLASFAFAIQRFSCAEWGSGTRKALVEAGVVDSLLAALRTAADEPFPQVHIDLALAVSFLGDVGGSSIRKEIVNAGGIDILKRVGKEGVSEVSKACSMAVTSITGNIWSRNAASAKTAMGHNWNGGCPEHQPLCPLVLTQDSDQEGS